MKFKKLFMNVQSHIEALYISFFPSKKRILKSIKYIDRNIIEIIENERGVIPRDRTHLSEMYWKAFKEMIQILVILEDEEEIRQAYKILDTIINSNAFEYWLPELTDIVHRHHPFFIKISWDTQGGPRIDGD